MSRHFEDWLAAYMDYAAFTEAPAHMHYWVGVSAIAAVLGRKVWKDEKAFRWYPNFYLMLVGPPGVVKKTTTLKQAVDLLCQMEDFSFGPNVMTWQALVKDFKLNQKEVEIAEGVFETQSNLYVASGEIGNFIDPTDKKCMDMLVALWDGEEIKKSTKKDGEERITKPMLNFAGCTTPSWIMANIPHYMIDGGLLSRIIAVYGEKRERRIALPSLMVKRDYYEVQQKLVSDLEEMSLLRGDIAIKESALKTVEEQYNWICDAQETEEVDGLLQRKQVHVFKLAMIIAAAKGSRFKEKILLTSEILTEAYDKVSLLEDQRKSIFKFVGKGRQALLVRRMVEVIARRGEMSAKELFRTLFDDCPNKEEFSLLIYSAMEAGQLRFKNVPGKGMVIGLG